MVGGDPALDFVNTASNWRSDDPVDRLGGYEGFADWAATAGVIDPRRVAALKAAAAADPEEAARLFAEALDLRAALWRIIDAAAHRRKAAPGDIKTLRRWTCRAGDWLVLEQQEEAFVERLAGEAPMLEAPVFEIALAAERLLKSAPLSRLHACGGDGCEWVFLDLSKNASRRWCSMATCGNSAKVKKFRKRKIGEASPDL